MQKTKKIKAGELLLKLRDAVIKLIEETRDLKNSIEKIEGRVENLEGKVKRLERSLQQAISSGSQKGIQAVSSMPEVAESGEVVDVELESLAKQIGIDLSPALPEKKEVPSPAKSAGAIPAPPPPPPIGEVTKRKTEAAELDLAPIPEPPKPKKKDIDMLSSEELLGVKQANEAELEKEKDELLKALKELDELR
ncbi:MAG: hypothetical protein ACP6IP_08850 [Candidatus Njordarchaeia archaeon]